MNRQDPQVAWAFAIYVSILLSVAFIATSFGDTRYEVDYGGQIYLHTTSWWGLSSRRHDVRLQDFEAWEKGVPYIAPNCLEGHEWFMQERNGEWYPIAEETDWTDQP